MLHRADTISRYSQRDYVIGDSDPHTLEQIEQRLTNGPSPDAELDSHPVMFRYELGDTSFTPAIAELP